MKNIYLLTLLICSIALFGQNRLVSKKVEELNLSNKRAVEFNLFSKNNDFQKNSKYSKAASDVTVLELNQSELKTILEEAPEFISLKIPYQNENVEVQLYQQNIFTDSFVAKDKKGNLIDYKPGKYYRGIVNGDYTSLVAISFFENNVIGIISSRENGNMVLGKSIDNNDFITYSDKNLLGNYSYECGADQLETDFESLPKFDYSMLAETTTTRCINIFYEIAYEPYFQNGSDTTATLDWMTGVHNNVATLFDNDGVNIAINAISIWTVEDPYDSDSFMFGGVGLALDSESDVVHIINSPRSISAGLTDSLCSGQASAYSNVNFEYENIPTYSWTVGVIAHEFGHVFGSSHTHACVWNGNNTSIDICGPLAGYPAEGDCGEIIPENGGTIMSYCHLIPEIGINFLNGFGPQPAALIRSRINAADCLRECATDHSLCLYSLDEIITTNIDEININIRFEDEVADIWEYQIYPLGQSPPEEWLVAESPEFNIDTSELLQNTYYVLVARNVCNTNILSPEKTAIFLTGKFCDGTLFTDSGGESGYGTNEHIVKTFYPSSIDEKVKLQFNRVFLQTSDILYIYDGNNTDSPLFEGGEVTGNLSPGPTFISTNETGTITVEFISDSSINYNGWSATVDCSALEIMEFDLSQIKIYPNPTSSVLNIDAQKEIISVRLNDISGKSILSKKSNALKEKLNIEHLPKGVYVLTVEMKGQTTTKKIIKN